MRVWALPRQRRRMFLLFDLLWDDGGKNRPRVLSSGNGGHLWSIVCSHVGQTQIKGTSVWILFLLLRIGVRGRGLRGHLVVIHYSLHKPGLGFQKKKKQQLSNVFQTLSAHESLQNTFRVRSLYVTASLSKSKNPLTLRGKAQRMWRTAIFPSVNFGPGKLLENSGQCFFPPFFHPPSPKKNTTDDLTMSRHL